VFNGVESIDRMFNALVLVDYKYNTYKLSSDKQSSDTRRLAS